MTRKILEWFNTMSEPYCSQALENFNRIGRVGPDTTFESLIGAINTGFIWMNTPEGDGYWRNIFNGYTKFPEVVPISTEITW